MKLIILYTYLLISIGCKSKSLEKTEVINNLSKKNKFSSEDSNLIKLHEGNWIVNFKNEVFISCLKKIYPIAFTTFIDTADASGSANIDRLNYNLSIIKVIDSLANQFSKRPEANWKIENSKVTINVCLEYRNSLELDSIALVTYNRFIHQ